MRFGSCGGQPSRDASPWELGGEIGRLLLVVGQSVADERAEVWGPGSDQRGKWCHHLPQARIDARLLTTRVVVCFMLIYCSAPQASRRTSHAAAAAFAQGAHLEIRTHPPTQPVAQLAPPVARAMAGFARPVLMAALLWLGIRLSVAAEVLGWVPGASPPGECLRAASGKRAQLRAGEIYSGHEFAP